jgi:formiminoglutamase
MPSFRIFSQSDILSLVDQRIGETKIGEKVAVYHSPDEKIGHNTLPLGKAISINALKQHTAKFVLLGIPEDIGVRANYGIGGAKTAWQPALKCLLNMQQNTFFKGENILVLGEFNIPDDDSATVENLRLMVSQIDDLVYPMIHAIVAAGKIPIVIGGGHNNCYPIIKGTSLAINAKIDVLNIDAHADLRNPEEGRHSGNGFSAAIAHQFLDQYRILGLKQNYINQAQLDFISHHDNVKAFYLDDILAYQQDLRVTAEILLNRTKSALGLEIDLDSVTGALSSASTPSGFTLNEVRQLLLQLQRKFKYLHICEGAYQLANGQTDHNMGKKIALLVSDFIKSHQLA